MGGMDAGVRTFSRIFGLSFSGKKIMLQICGMICACIASFLILTLLGGFILQQRLHWVIEILNAVAVIFIMFFTWGAIAKITIAEVADLPPVDAASAAKAALKSAKPLIIAPLKIVAVILILMLIHAICGWIGLIPVLGEIVWPFLAVPLFIVSALIVVSVIILLCGTLLLPPIIMAGKESPVSELNDFLRENTLRFIGYLIATLVVVGIVFIFLDGVVATNNLLCAKAMGDKYATIAASVPGKVDAATRRVARTLIIPERSCSYVLAERVGGSPAGLPDTRFTYRFAGLVWGMFMLLIRLVILSLPFVIWCVSGTLIYLGLKPSAAPGAA